MSEETYDSAIREYPSTMLVLSICRVAAVQQVGRKGVAPIIRSLCHGSHDARGGCVGALVPQVPLEGDLVDCIGARRKLEIKGCWLALLQSKRAVRWGTEVLDPIGDGIDVGSWRCCGACVSIAIRGSARGSGVRRVALRGSNGRGCSRGRRSSCH